VEKEVNLQEMENELDSIAIGDAAVGDGEDLFS